MLLLLAAAASAAETKINGVTYGNSGSVVPPQSTKDMLGPEFALRLKKLFLFPSMDDVSGALAPKLDEKLAELFSRNSRFELIRDPQVVKALSPDENSYYKAAQNQTVHKEAAKVVGADTTVLLRTRNVGQNTQMTLELRDANGNFLFVEEGSVPGTAPMEARWILIEKLYKGMLGRMPFEGAVTGRTAATLTVDLGFGTVKLGEEFEIARVVSVQRHPLLGTVVGTDYVRTGRARITAVDRVLSFAEVVEENPGEHISPGQKILQARNNIVHRPGVGEEKAPPLVSVKQGKDQIKEEPDPFNDRLQGDFDKPKQRFGQIGGNLYYGSLSQTQTTAGATREFSGSGLSVDAGGEIWVTKNWILHGAYAYQAGTLSGPSGALGASSWQDFTFLVGYRVFPENLTEGIALTGSLGYDVMRFDIPASAAMTVSGKRYSGLVLQLDGDIAFMDKQKVTLGFGIQPFSSMTELGPSLGPPSGGTVITFHLGWNKQLMNEVWLKIGLKYLGANGSYENAATVSNKRFAIGPGIYYLF